MNGHEYLRIFLHGQNISYEETDGLIKFPIADVNFFAFKNDSPFLQIMIAVKAPSVSKAKLLDICNNMNQTHFVTKFTYCDDDGSIWCNYELFPNEGMTPECWKVILSVLDSASDDLIDKLSNIK